MDIEYYLDNFDHLTKSQLAKLAVMVEIEKVKEIKQLNENIRDNNRQLDAIKQSMWHKR